MDNGMTGCDFSHWLRYLFGCRNNLSWLDALIRLSPSSFYSSLLCGYSGQLFWWLVNLVFLRPLRFLGFRKNIFIFLVLISLFSSLVILFQRSRSLLAHQLKLIVFDLALRLIHAGFCKYLATSCFLNCLFGFVSLNFFFISFFLHFCFL